MAIINSRTPMVTPTSTILLPKELDGVAAVVDKYGWEFTAGQTISGNMFLSNGLTLEHPGTESVQRIDILKCWT